MGSPGTSDFPGASVVRVVEDARVAHTPALPLSHSCRFVPPGGERAFLSAFPLSLFEAEGADPHVLALLEGVGVGTCGGLAALEREAVEVRFGVEGVRLWRLARADDARVLFAPVPPERPHVSLDFVDYVVTDPERLAFTLNALLGSICDALHAQGEHARRLRLVLELASGTRWEQGLRPGRPTASRAVWLRLARAALDQATLPDAVAGVHLEVEATEPAAVRQGDLFDAGFATAPAVEAAVLRLLESQGEVVVRPEADAHPLAERRVRWRPVSVDEVVGATAPETAERESGGVGEWATAASAARRRSWAARLPKERQNAGATFPHSPARPLPRSGDEADERPGPLMTLQLLPVPRVLDVETMLRGDHEVPVRYREPRADATQPRVPGTGASRWQAITSVAGPDRLSGGIWEDAYAREYFRALTADGALVWLFRDARRESWFLHGWWD